MVKQKTLLILAIIFLVFSVGLFYVNKVLLPVQVKGMIVKALSEQTGRTVSLGTLQWGPLQGAMITDLVIYDKDSPTDIFVHIQNASAQILIVPFFSKKIIIPSMKIDGLALYLIKTDKETWNFSDLIKPSAPGAGNPLADVLISSFALTHARITLVDRSSEEGFSDVIDPLNIKGSLSLVDGFHIFGEMMIPSTQGTLKFDTRTGLRDKTFKGDFKITNTGIARYVRFLPVPLPVLIEEGTLKSADLSISAEDKDMTVSGSAQLPGLNLVIPKDTRIKADLNLNKFSLASKNGSISFQGDITAQKTDATFQDQTVKGDLRANILSLSLENGQLNAAADIEAKNVSALLSGDQKFQGNITLAGLKIVQKGKGLSANADVQLKNLAFQTAQGQSISGDLSLTKAETHIKGTQIELQTQLKFEKLKVKNGETVISGELTSPDLVILNNNALDITMTARLNGNEITLPQGLMFSGNPSFGIHLHSEGGALSYDGVIDLADGALKNLPMIEAIKEISGKILFETDKLSTQNLSFNALDTSVRVSGEVTSLAHPMLNLEASAKDVDLALAERLAPQFFKDQGLKVSGKATITARIEGAATKIDQAKIIATADISGASVESSKLKQNIENISGLVTYTAPTLSWKTLNLDFQKKTYLLNGHMQDFSNPYITTSVKGIDMSLDIQAQKIGDNIQIKDLNASFFDSSMSAKGLIDLPPGKDPLIDITADGKLVIRDIPKFLPQYEKNIADLKLAGILKFTTAINGTATDWQNWNADVSVTTPALSCMGYEINNLNIAAQERKGSLQPLEIKGTLYGGDFGIISPIGLVEPGFPFDATFKITRTDLALLKRDIPALQQKQFSGFLTIAGGLKGKVMDWKNMTGQSTVEITDGYLWEFPVLTKILSILSTSFQGGDVIITEASATLAMGEGRVTTNNLTLKSAAVSLIGEGWVDFDQNVDLNITPKVEPKSGKTGNPIGLINPTEGLLNLHVTGTLQKPKIENNLSAPTVIKKTLQNTVGNILKIFE